MKTKYTAKDAYNIIADCHFSFFDKDNKEILNTYDYSEEKFKDIFLKIKDYEVEYVTTGTDEEIYVYLKEEYRKV